MDLSVFNRWGQALYQHPAYDHTWTGDNLPEGIYFLRLENEVCDYTYKSLLHLRR